MTRNVAMVDSGIAVFDALSAMGIRIRDIQKRGFMLLAWMIVLCLFPSEMKAQQHVSDIADQRKLTYFYLAAQQQKTQKNYSAMTDLLLHCLQIAPNDPAANFDMAMVQLSLYQDSLGMESLKRAVNNDPQNPWYRETLASIYLNKNETDKAMNELEKIAKLQTKRTDVLAQLFQLYKKEKRYQDAIHALDRIETLQGKNTRIATQKYGLYLEKGDTVQAFEQLRALCREYPYDATNFLLLGDQYMSVQMNDSALQAYAQAERIDPKNVMLQTSRLQYHLLTGDTLRFRTLRDSVILDDKADLNIRVNSLGSAAREGVQDSTLRAHADSIFATLLSQPKPPVQFLQLYLSYKVYTSELSDEELIPIMERILEVDPSNLQTRQDMVEYYVALQDAEHIESLCKNGLTYHPTELRFHYTLGIALAQQKKIDEAIQALTTATRQVTEEANPELVGALYVLLGDMYHEQGFEKKAFEAYDSCLVYTPENVSCLNNYAYFLSLKNEKLDKAEQMSYRAVRAEPNSKTYIDTYAWVLFMQEDYTTARIYIDRVIDPAAADSTLLNNEEINAVLLEHAGDIYAQCNLTDQALRYWQLALQLDSKNAIIKKKIKKRKYIKR